MKKVIVTMLVMLLMGAPCHDNLSFAKVDGDNAAVMSEVAETKENVQQGTESPDLAEKLRADAEAARKLVIARVDGADISMFDLVRVMNKIAPKYIKKGENITPEITAQIKKDALDALIFEELAIKEAERQNIIIEDKKIQTVINNVKESMGSDEGYEKYLGDKALTEEKLKELIKRGQLREIVMAREIYGKVKVDPAKIKEEYEKMKAEGLFRRKENSHVKEIYILKGENEESTRKRAEELLAEVKANNNEFGPLILDGTFITRSINVTEEKNPEVYKAMMKMEVGELSDVIKDKDTFHIIKVERKEPARDSTLEEATGYIENRLRLPAQKEREKTWKEELFKNAKIEIFLDEVEKKLKEDAEAKKKD